MLTPPVTIAILICTLLLFFFTVLLPVKFNIKKFFNPPDDHFISSRNTQSWVSIGLSLYAGAVGTWALTAPPETAVIGGWWALLGYAVGCGCPWAIYTWSGGKLRRLMQNRGFTSLEFVYERYGRAMQVVVTLVSIVYLMGILVAELTAIGTCLVAISPGFQPIIATVSVSIVTNVYSALGGFPASMLTDKLQAILTVILLIICYGVVFGTVTPHIEAAAWSASMTWQSSGIPTALVLIFSCFLVEQINQATWQRVFAAKSERDMYWGFIFGVFLMFPSMILFGISGLFGKAASISGFIDLPVDAAYEAMFLLLAKLPDFWLGCVAFLVVGLVTSTADSVQTGLSAMIAGELTHRKISLNWARVFSLALNVPAVLLAAYNPPSILLVMMLINIISVAVVPVVLLGFTCYVTTIGAVLGVVSSWVSIILLGICFTGTFVGGLAWGTFPNGYDWECFTTFVVVALVSALVALLVSALEMRLNPAKRQLQIDRLEAIKARDDEAALDVDESTTEDKPTLEEQVPEKPIKNDV